MELKGQVALVTGASRGIGAAILRELGEHGAFVIGTGTSEQSAEAVRERLKAYDLEGFALVLDVSRQGSVDALMAELERRGAIVSILVNNAGVTRDSLLMRMRDEDWESVVDTNLGSVYRLCKALLRGMLKARYGRIVNVTSVVGQAGNPGQTNYAAAKAGIVGFTKSLAREVASRGITVNCVAPGFIDTDMTRVLSESQRSEILCRIPMNRLGRVEEVAAAVRFLASPAASYITGETLSVNGGMYMQ